MAITNDELQSIISAVLQAVRTNSKTIDQLVSILNLGDNDLFEINNGRSVKASTIKTYVFDGLRGIAGGLATLGTDGKVPEIQLPQTLNRAYTFTGDLDIGETLTVGGDADIKGNVSVGGDIALKDGVTINGGQITLSERGKAFYKYSQGQHTIDGAVSILGTLYMSGNVEIDADLSVIDLTVGGDLTLNGNIHIPKYKMIEANNGFYMMFRGTQAIVLGDSGETMRFGLSTTFNRSVTMAKDLTVEGEIDSPTLDSMTEDDVKALFKSVYGGMLSEPTLPI